MGLDFMRVAYEQALKSYEEGGLPIGAALVENGAVIATGHNRRVQDGDPIAQFGIKSVVIGEARNFPGNVDFLRQHGVDVTVLDDPDCITLMARFIQERPELWYEDIAGREKV